METFWDPVKFTSTFHHQTDRQHEVVNRSLGTPLTCLVGECQGNADLLIRATEFTYNSSVNRSTSKSPFEGDQGFTPHQPIDLVSLPPNFVLLSLLILLLNIFVMFMPM